MSSDALFGVLPVPQDHSLMLGNGASTSTTVMDNLILAAVARSNTVDYFGTGFLTEALDHLYRAHIPDLHNTLFAAGTPISSASRTALVSDEMRFLSPSTVNYVANSSTTTRATDTGEFSRASTSLATQFLVDSSSFSWPNFDTPTQPTFNSAKAVDTYIFNTIEERAPTTEEEAKYVSELEALPVTQFVQNGVIVNWRNYSPVMNEVAHLQITTDKLQGQFQTGMGQSVSDDIIASGEDSLGKGVPFGKLREAIFNSGVETGAINVLYEDVHGRSANDSDQQFAHQQLYQNGETFQQLRINEAHNSESVSAINAAYDRILDRTPDTAGLTLYEDQIGNGQTLASAISSIAHSAEAATHVQTDFQDILGRGAVGSDVSHYEDMMANGWALSNMRYDIAHSDEAATHVQTDFQDILGRSAVDSDISHYEDMMANGWVLTNMRYDIAHSAEATQYIRGDFQFILGRTASSDDLNHYQERMVNGWALSNVGQDIAHSAEANVQIQNVYADWGQLPPDTGILQTAGTALYNLSYAWITTVHNQSANQLSIEAAAYSPSVSVSFQDMVIDLASSTHQAVALEANVLVNTYLESSADPDDARNFLQAGGENAMSAAFDEASVLTELKKIDNENMDSCDPVRFRTNTSIVKNISNDDIKSANQTFGDLGGASWDQSYKELGIQWKSKNSSTTANQQGLPYEAWVQNQINPSQDPSGVIWLQAEKPNWKTFDHWDQESHIATSDKTINLSADSYRDRPNAVAARVKASVAKMIGYRTDQSTDDTVVFRQTDITSYALNLGVPYITDPATMDDQTRAEWKVLCRAYHDAMKDVVAANHKSLTFNINPVS